MTSIIKKMRGIVEQGTANGGRYIKYDDGYAEFWGWKNAQVAPSAWKDWGSLKYAIIDGIVYPTGLFIETPYAVNAITGTTNDLWMGPSAAIEKTGTPNFMLLKIGAPNANIIVSFGCYAYARWK